MKSNLSLSDLAFNIECFDNLHANAKKEVLEQVISELKLLNEIEGSVNAISTEGSYAIPWTFRGGVDGKDETEDVKITDCNRNPVVRTDSGYYEPNCQNAKLITECVNLIWDLKNKFNERKS